MTRTFAWSLNQAGAAQTFGIGTTAQASCRPFAFKRPKPAPEETLKMSAMTETSTSLKEPVRQIDIIMPQLR